MKVSFVYISLSGNTESFVRRLSDYLLEAHPGLEIEKVPDLSHDFTFLRSNISLKS